MSNNKIANAQRIHDVLHGIDVNPGELNASELGFLHAVIAHQTEGDLEALISLLVRAHRAGKTRAWREALP